MKARFLCTVCVVSNGNIKTNILAYLSLYYHGISNHWTVPIDFQIRNLNFIKMFEF